MGTNSRNCLAVFHPIQRPTHCLGVSRWRNSGIRRNEGRTGYESKTHYGSWFSSNANRADLIESNRRRIEALYRDLDGLKGEAVEKVRGLLKGTTLDSPIPADLEERVRQVSEDASGEEDRRFALETVAGIFSELGYKVDDEFATVVPEEGLLLELPGSRAHGLLVRERDINCF